MSSGSAVPGSGSPVDGNCWSVFQWPELATSHFAVKHPVVNIVAGLVCPKVLSKCYWQKTPSFNAILPRRYMHTGPVPSRSSHQTPILHPS
jgi:hypothetical protein